MARVFGFVGGLFVPVGLVRVAADAGVAFGKWRRACAVAALVAASIVALAFAGLTFSGPALGIAALALAVGLLRRMAARELPQEHGKRFLLDRTAGPGREPRPGPARATQGMLRFSTNCVMCGKPTVRTMLKGERLELPRSIHVRPGKPPL